MDLAKFECVGELQKRLIFADRPQASRLVKKSCLTLLRIARSRVGAEQGVLLGVSMG